MTQEPTSSKKKIKRQVVGLGSAAIGIAIVLWLSNGNGDQPQISGATPAQSASMPCSEDKALAAKIDAQAHGELAGLRVTAKGDDHRSIAFKSPTGSDLTIADLSGKILLVNFWATWCGPCREEMPALDNLQAKFGGDDFEVVTISLDLGDKGLAKAQGFFSQNKLNNLKLYSDPSFKSFDYVKAKGLSLGLPTSVLLDKNGCELGVLTGPAEWDSEEGFATMQAAIDGV